MTAQFCKPHRDYGLGTRFKSDGLRKYNWTPEQVEILREAYTKRVRGRQRLLATQFGYPPHQISSYAQRLGFTDRPLHRRWSKDEIQKLRELLGDHSVKAIAMRLGRTAASVAKKARHLALSTHVTGDGYTVQEVSDCFGVVHRQVERWIAEGRLVARRKEGMIRPWEISERALRDFIIANPMAFDIRRVDQVWFVSVLAKRPVASYLMEE